MEHKKYLIAVPCLDMMQTGFVASLVGMQRVGACKHSFLANSLVYDARNMLAAEAIDTGADRVLFLDSDMAFGVDLMQRLADDMDEGCDFVSGLYFGRRFPLKPLVYKSVAIVDTKDGLKGKTEAYSDYPEDALFPIAGSGFGAVMLSTKLLKDVYDTCGYPFAPMPGVLGEDLAFCLRAKQLGYMLYCDSRIKLKHIGSFRYGEEHYIRTESDKDVAQL